MFSVALRHLALVGSFFQRKMLKIILYDYIGTKKNIIQAGFMIMYSFS